MDLPAVVFGIMRDRMPFVTMDDFLAKTSGFEFLPVTVGGECVGAIMRRGPELHAAVLPSARGRWLGRRALAIIAETIGECGRATTAVMDDHRPGHDFALRLGFKRAGSANGMTFYEKTAC